MTDIYHAAIVQNLLASLTFVPAEWLPDVAAIVSTVPELEDLEEYRIAIGIVAARVLNLKHHEALFREMPASDTVQ